jgi:hypothetical protein
LDLNLTHVTFSDSVYAIYACISDLAPPLIGAAPVRVVKIHEVLEFSEKTSRTSRR